MTKIHYLENPSHPQCAMQFKLSDSSCLERIQLCNFSPQNIVFRKQNKLEIRNKVGIQSQENWHIYKLKLRHGPCIYLVKLFDFEGAKDKLVLPWCPGHCNFASLSFGPVKVRDKSLINS